MSLSSFGKEESLRELGGVIRSIGKKLGLTSRNSRSLSNKGEELHRSAQGKTKTK